MTTPKISVVTPSYNQAAFVEQTINSVLTQDYPNLEYIVIDGASTDGSDKVIERYQSQLHYCVSEPDRGHAHALNKGFEQSSGEIMAWLNSDDMYLPWTFQVVAQIFEQFPNVQWVQGHPSYWSDTGFLIPMNRTLLNAYDFLQGNYRWIQQESVFWRRSLWQETGGYIDENCELMVDGELWSRFFRYSELHYVDCALGGYRIHGSNRASEHSDTCIVEMDRIVEKMRSEFPKEQLSAFRSMRAFGPLGKSRRKSKVGLTKAVAKTFPKTFKPASYPVLSYKNGGWQERRLPFGSK